MSDIEPGVYNVNVNDDERIERLTKGVAGFKIIPILENGTTVSFTVIIWYYKSSLLSGLTSFNNGWFLSASDTSASSKFSHLMPKVGSA